MRSKLSEHVAALVEQPLGVQAEAFKLASAAAEVMAWVRAFWVCASSVAAAR